MIICMDIDTVTRVILFLGDAMLLSQIMKEKMLKMSDLESMDSTKLIEIATACNIKSRGKSAARDCFKALPGFK